LFVRILSCSFPIANPKVGCLGAALILFVMTTTGAAAQQHLHVQDDLFSDSGITVMVYRPDGRPLGQLAYVTLYAKGSNMALRTVMTSSSSEAVLTSMPGYGLYTVGVTADGYVTERKDFEFNSGSGHFEIDVTLHPLSDSAPSPKAQEHAQKGFKAMQEGKYQDAQAEFMAAQKAAPQSAEVCYLLGAAYQKGNDLKNAQVYLEKAISIDPDHVNALVALGQVFDQLKDYQAAIAPLEKACTLDGKEWHARWTLADAYLRVGAYERALKYAQAAVELGDGAANRAELIEGQALAQLGRRDDAIKVLEAFLHDLPGDPAVPSVRAFITELQNSAPKSPGKSN
jgi:tetratricopeptide (TPR) repeat protein